MISAVAGEPFIAVGGLDYAHLHIGPGEAEATGIGEWRLGPQAGRDDLVVRGDGNRGAHGRLADRSESLGEGECRRELKQTGEERKRGERRAEAHKVPRVLLRFRCSCEDARCGVSACIASKHENGSNVAEVACPRPTFEKLSIETQ